MPMIAGTKTQHGETQKDSIYVDETVYEVARSSTVASSAATTTQVTSSSNF